MITLAAAEQLCKSFQKRAPELQTVTSAKGRAQTWDTNWYFN